MSASVNQNWSMEKREINPSSINNTPLSYFLQESKNRKPGIYIYICMHLFICTASETEFLLLHSESLRILLWFSVVEQNQ